MCGTCDVVFVRSVATASAAASPTTPHIQRLDTLPASSTSHGSVLKHQMSEQLSRMIESTPRPPMTAGVMMAPMKYETDKRNLLSEPALWYTNHMRVKQLKYASMIGVIGVMGGVQTRGIVNCLDVVGWVISGSRMYHCNGSKDSPKKQRNSRSAGHHGRSDSFRFGLWNGLTSLGR